MNIALFGGRFDPVHNGHLAIANEVLNTEKIDEIWFVPDNIHQWNPIVASVHDRFKMLGLATQQNKAMKISDAAILLGGITYTINVVKKLKKTSHNFIFVCGSDQIPNFHKWVGWNELSRILSFLIIPRKDFPVTNLPKNCKLLSDKNYHPLEDASTIIRQKIKNGLSISDFVSKSVEEYIIKQALYK